MGVRGLGRVERAFGILMGSPFLEWVGGLGVYITRFGSWLVRYGLMGFVLTELSISFLLRVLEQSVFLLAGE